jgi:hypothetical protein
MKLAEPIVADQTLTAQPSEPATAAWQEWFTPGRVVLLIGVLLFAQYPEVFLGTHSFFNHDFGLFTYPTVHYLRDCFLRGEIPLWNPLNDCGLPFLAQWNTSVCYPPAWFCVLLPLPWSLNMLCLGHLLLAGYSMYLLTFRWTGNRVASSVAAVGYALNGFTFNCLMWISNMGALAWMPLTILLVERAWREGGRRRIITASLAAAMQMLSGAPEIILITWMMLGTLWLSQAIAGVSAFKHSAARLGSVAMLVAGLSAIQILPFLQLLAESDRRTEGGTSVWSMPAWGLANFIVPLFRCARSIIGPYFQIEQQWTTSFYPGLVIVVLAIVAIWFFALATFRNQGRGQPNPAMHSHDNATRIMLGFLVGWAVLGVLLAFGDHFVAYPLLKKLIPGFGFIRYPIKFLVPTIFSLSLLAAFTVRWLIGGRGSASHEDMRQAGPPSRSTFRLLLAFGALAVALIAGIVACSRIFPYREEVWSITALNGVGRVAFLAAGLALLLGAAKGGRLAGWFTAGFLVVLGVDATTHMPRQNPTVSVHAFDQLALGMSEKPAFGKSRAMVSPEVEGLLRRAALRDRFAYYVGNRRCLFEDCNLAEGIPKINGFFSLHLASQHIINALVYGETNAPSGLMDFLGVSQISSAKNPWQWDRRPAALPLVTAGQQPIFAGSDQIRRLLAEPQFDATRTVCLPAEARPDFHQIKPGSVQVAMLEARAHKIRVQTQSQSSSILVLAQSHYPAWRASVDGHPAIIATANLAFQAIHIPAGSHRVEFVYRDRAFEWGALITSISIAGCLTLWGWAWYCKQGSLGSLELY